MIGPDRDGRSADDGRALLRLEAEAQVVRAARFPRAANTSSGTPRTRVPATSRKTVLLDALETHRRGGEVGGIGHLEKERGSELPGRRAPPR